MTTINDDDPKKAPSLKARLVERMHDPLQLRAALCVTLLAAWYSIGYTPMRDRIAATTAKLDRDRKRLALATEVETLREKAAEFADRIPPRSDPNEFLQYILGGIRSGPVKMVWLIPEKAKDAGAYQVTSVRVELEGKYQDVDAFLRWIENDKRLLRVDNLKLDPDSRVPDSLRVSLNILGLIGIEELAKPAPKAEVAKAKAKKAKTKTKTKTGSKVTPPKGRPSAPKSAKSS